MFSHLHNITECPSLEEALRSKYIVGYKPNQLKAPSSFNNSRIVATLQAKFGKCGGVFIKNDPWSLYDWHTDIGRQCSLNWVLKANSRAVTLYRTLIEAPEGHRSITYNITEVDYTIGKPTLMDTTKEHCVINATDEERIIFSLSLDAPFNEVKEFLSVV
jgi:hypothetical protein